MFDSINTNYLVSVTSIIGTISWIATMFLGKSMLGQITIGKIIILISLGWIFVTVLTAIYLRHKANSSLVNLLVWKVWLGLSILGCIINISAGVMLENGIYPSFSYNYAVILPWLIIYAVGYLFTGLHDFDNKSLSNKERLSYVIIGIISGLLGGYLYLNPILYTEMIIMLTVLTLAQMVTIPLRIVRY